MPANQKQYIIPTGVLFHTLNVNRQSKGLASVEEALIARKLGILFTFKTNNYLNFKRAIIQLTDDELRILEEILTEYFNVDMGNKLNQIAIQPNNAPDTDKQHKLASSKLPEKQGFFNKIKGFLKKTPNK
jgi:hypothetical protein